MFGILLGLALFAGQNAGSPVAMKMETADGIPVRVITVDLNSPRVQVGVQVARGLPHGADSFQTFIERTHPTAAINGAYASKATLEPIGDIVIGGKRVYQGWMGTALALTKDKQALIRRVKRGHKEDWTGYETVVACGPALVLDGRIDCFPEEEGFKDPHVMGHAQRMGVGLTKNNKMLLVHALKPITFRKWAQVMLALGCQNAMNLDAGASLGMYYKGNMLHKPGRHITNVLSVFVDKPMPPLSRLVPHEEVASNAAPLPRDPGNSTALDAVSVRLCADSMQRAMPWCQTTVTRRIAKGKTQGECTLHRAPVGERRR